MECQEESPYEITVSELWSVQKIVNLKKLVQFLVENRARDSVACIWKLKKYILQLKKNAFDIFQIIQLLKT